MTKNNKENHFTEKEALLFHSEGKPGKIEIKATKPLETQRDLSLAYSPGVASPVNAIAENVDTIFDYTSKGNLVGVISNGTAILGLGNLGAHASKPVMEGKAVLFKRFADIDSIDLEIDTEDADEFINSVKYLGPTFGGINLEDIKAPECFIIEDTLRELMDIPIFHDDQHGTAIISAAALINALDLVGKDLKTAKIVVNGAGAAGIACLELLKAMGMPNENAILCDTKGVIHTERKENLNQWKSAHAIKTKLRTLEEALVDSDIFFGLSKGGIVSQKMVESMNDKPIIFAMANPEPEIIPEMVREVRPDAIIATGRSDYPNQVNNVLGFPYIFRGALDVRATTINLEMKIAAAKAIASLAKEDVPDEVANAYPGKRPQYGPNYIIPSTFDPRLISKVPPAVAKAAMDSGVARKAIVDMESYTNRLSARLNPSAGLLQSIFQDVKENPKRVIFAEGEEEDMIRAAAIFLNNGMGTPILIGREEIIKDKMNSIGLDFFDQMEIHNTRNKSSHDRYAEHIYQRLQRKGFLKKDCLDLLKKERNVFGACMVSLKDADAMICGLNRSYALSLESIEYVLDPIPNKTILGLTVMLCNGRTIFVADTNVHDMPNAQELADITHQSAEVVREVFGIEPRAALLSYSNFGKPFTERSAYIRDAIKILDNREVNFEYDGEMGANVAVNENLLNLYPFCKLSGPANLLIMPAIHSASISTKLLQELGGGNLVGPYLVGFNEPIQIAPLGANVADVVNLAALAAFKS
ncbi:MAG: NADP-dependent malic enzyme [Candidatus Pelagibacterales bacterium]|jgi:malate dehydrogenase (oxaloacetate-decarboxylating)(NADP+)